MTGPLRAVFLVGQTASGKSAVGFRLAREIGAEIISLDSMKVYRGMDIGTAKPTPDRRRAVPHHLLDVVDPHEHFSTARYVEKAEAAAEAIAARGNVPLFVGGTALYLKALVEGLFEGPPADPAFRAGVRRQAAERGNEFVHRRLAEVDPEAARRIHPNDIRRIERALEVYEQTGRPISDLQEQFGTPREELDATVLGLRRERADLLRRIDRRVDRMMAGGLLDEVRRLVSRPEPPGREARQALGYAELMQHLAGELSLDEAVELIKVHTRQFARAQMTWFKRMEWIHWFEVGPDEPAGETAGRLRRFLTDQDALPPPRT
ncbi:MAG: tRNA (adenosine(37)-N6)-dimethylallyltransferase MiaA [Planctomycetota bacterium]